MLTISTHGLVSRAVFTVFTLYMMLFLVRWLALYLQIDLYNPRLRWVTGLTEPLLRPVRRHVPNLGHWDISFVVAVLIVFALRQVSVTFLARMGM